jgi:CDP-diacylglycerol--serine O-phosphatidyltransferase
MITRRKRTKEFFVKYGARLFPFLFTFGNAFFGFFSIILAFEGEKVTAAYCIFISALMDALDGRVARLMKVESELGVELDSLCDAISFCLAPAFLIYVWQLRTFGFVGAVIGALFLLAGLFRLARFNLLHDEQTVFFIGLPTTIAGCFVATILLNAHTLKHTLLLAYNVWLPFINAGLLLVLAWLMISSVRFPAFKRGIVKKHSVGGIIPLFITIAIVLFAIMAVMRLQVALVLLFIAYFIVAALGGLIREEKEKNESIS